MLAIIRGKLNKRKVIIPTTFEIDEAALIGIDSVLYAMEKVHLIKDRLKTS